MAAPKSIAIRQQQARDRILREATALAKRAGVEMPDLAPRHKDAGIAAALQLEAMADLLGSINAAQAKKQEAEKREEAASDAPEPGKHTAKRK